MSVDQVLKEFETMTLGEVADFIRRFKDKFEVTTPTLTSLPGPVPLEAAPVEEEQTEFTVALIAAGQQKIKVIQAVRNHLKLGLKESKALVDAAPSTILIDVDLATAEAMKRELEDVGATVGIQ